MTEDHQGGMLIAGFDAGQTHTTCRLSVFEAAERPGPLLVGTMLAEGEGPGVSHLASPDGPERFRTALRYSLSQAIQALPTGTGGGATAPLRAAAVGASGIEQGTTVQRQGLELAASVLHLPEARVQVCGDERTALRGAFGSGAGVVVISGTGTISVGRDQGGREARCGGWGWLLDDAGSAMDIGRDGLAVSLRMADGRIPDTPLRMALWQTLGLDPDDPGSPQRLKALVVAPTFGPAGFARLAPEVDRLAGEGDAHATGILSASAESLAAMAGAVARRLALEAPPVCPMGGAITHLPMFRARFELSLQRHLPDAPLVAPLGDACDGALAMASELITPVGSDPDGLRR